MLLSFSCVERVSEEPDLIPAFLLYRRLGRFPFCRLPEQLCLGPQNRAGTSNAGIGELGSNKTGW